jgi:hypothetical protein
MNENQLRKAETAARALQSRTSPIPRPGSAPGVSSSPKSKAKDPTVQAPAKGAPLTVTKATASPRASADQGTPNQAPAKGVKRQSARQQSDVQESPSAQSSTGTSGPGVAEHPMVTRTRKKASGAGGLRGVAGSGETQGAGMTVPLPNLGRNLFP